MTLDTQTAHAMADAAISQASRLGAQHVDFRLGRISQVDVRVRDGRLEGSEDSAETGFGVRVVHDGAWGFAAGGVPGTDEAARVAGLACQAARLVRPLRGEPVELADEPVYRDAEWVSPYQIDPLEVPAGDRVTKLQEWSELLLSAAHVDHVMARLFAVREEKFYADGCGTTDPSNGGSRRVLRAADTATRLLEHD